MDNTELLRQDKAMTYQTDQERFWTEEFGSEYMKRNDSEILKKSCVNQFHEILTRFPQIRSATEFGSNIGNNIEALSQLNKELDLTAIEINPKAAEILRAKNICRVINESILDYTPDHLSDMTFTSGVLIHINPDFLPGFYEKLYATSSKYILLIEYYNPTPVAIDYRGHKDRLFKRDFAGDMMDLYPDLTLEDYGFFYNRDSRYPIGSNTNWFMMKKAG